MNAEVTHPGLRPQLPRPSWGPGLTTSHCDTARGNIGGLRGMLTQAAVQALDPDLVILNKFAHFRDLLDLKTGDEAAELAHDLDRERVRAVAPGSHFRAVLGRRDRAVCPGRRRLTRPCSTGRGGVPR